VLWTHPRWSLQVKLSLTALIAVALVQYRQRSAQLAPPAPAKKTVAATPGKQTPEPSKVIASPSMATKKHVIRVELVSVGDYQSALGKATKIVTVDWKNIGSAPVHTVRADIKPMDRYGNPAGEEAKNYTIFAYEDFGRKPIPPGKSYMEKEEDGFVLMPGSRATNATVTIISVE